MLKLTDIRKDYKVASGVVHALKGISLEFRKNEFVCVLGASGCGKTTLLNIIGGLDHYTSGDLEIQGKSTKDFRDRDWDVYRNHRIGFIFQTYNLIPHQTVLSNVELALTIAGIGKEERRNRAKQALERVGLGAELNKRPNQLSGGQMQRVAIARALVNNPDILLADEPTGALDSKTSVQIMDLIREISGERLVIMVTHNPELAEEYASRIVRLKDGLVEDDSDPYTASNEEHAAEEFSEREALTAAPKQKGAKKLRAKMGFFTALALSFRNLLTKKGRTVITSIGGSIGIISVCLVLALSNGFGNYIKKTEEDMLSAYPLEISESSFDLSAVMSGIMSPQEMPDLKKLGDKVYINSFLTGLAQGMAIQNNVTPEYVEYLEKGMEDHPEDYAAIQYRYGFSLADAIFTPMEAVNPDQPDKTADDHFTTRYFSVNALKQYLIDELMEEADQFSPLLQFVHYFTDVINKMPGTSDFEDPNFADYVSSQYDIVNAGGRLPENEHEAVMVIGPNNDVIDLTLVQLGFLDEERFLDLFRDAQTSEELETAATTSATAVTEDEEGLTPAEANKRLDFSRITEQQYMLYYSDALYRANSSYDEADRFEGKDSSYPFEYVSRNGRAGEIAEQDFTSAVQDEKGEQGISFKITAILRLKEGFSYGCLEEGLNFPEATIDHYIEHNKNSEIVQWMSSDDAKVPEWFTDLLGERYEGLKLYFSPASYLNGQYSAFGRDNLVKISQALLASAFSAMQGSTGGSFSLPDKAAASYWQGIVNMVGPTLFEQLLQGIASSDGVQGTIFADIPAGTGKTLSDNVSAKLGLLDPNKELEKEDFVGVVADSFVDVVIEDPNGIEKLNMYFTYSLDPALHFLGASNEVSELSIYPSGFEGKQHIKDYLDAWNDTVDARNAAWREEHPELAPLYPANGGPYENITYTDQVGVLMGMIETIFNLISYVLVAFTAISLIVSSVMIGIITYVSVVERVKEIGVLRSLGARKRDIRSLFNSETFIIGLGSGVFGVIVAYILSAIISAVLFHFTGIAGMASLAPLTAFIMICVSVVLTLISGLIPAQAAAKKDPVIALRTE